MDLTSLYQFDTSSPVMLSMPDFEPLEFIWRKGPFEEPLRDLPASVSEPQPALKLLTPTDEEQVLIGEDEMAAWLHYAIDMPDARADLNRQTRDESSNSLPSVVLGKAAKSDCQVGPVEINSMHAAKAGGLALQRGVEGKADAQIDSVGQNEDSLVELNYSTINSDKKRKDAVRRSLCPRKSHITKGHNLSEQRRRSRINERMKTLQALIPRSSKLDKASILDATIAHVKALQNQVKIISMGFPIRPSLFHRGPPYIQSMPLMPSLGVGMGMNTDIQVSMNMAAMGIRPGMPPFGLAMPYPHINQPVQASILEMPGQNMVAAGMFPYSLIGDPCHFPSVTPGQASPQVAVISEGSV